MMGREEGKISLMIPTVMMKNQRMQISLIIPKVTMMIVIMIRMMVIEMLGKTLTRRRTVVVVLAAMTVFSIHLKTRMTRAKIMQKKLEGKNRLKRGHFPNERSLRQWHGNGPVATKTMSERRVVEIRNRVTTAIITLSEIMTMDMNHRNLSTL